MVLDTVTDVVVANRSCPQVVCILLNVICINRGFPQVIYVGSDMVADVAPVNRECPQVFPVVFDAVHIICVLSVCLPLSPCTPIVFPISQKLVIDVPMVPDVVIANTSCA